MAQITLRRGTAKELSQKELEDGCLSFTIDDGRIHLDYLDEADNEVKRKTFYSGKLTIGSHVYDGTEDVFINEYEGEIK